MPEDPSPAPPTTLKKTKKVWCKKKTVIVHYYFSRPVKRKQVAFDPPLEPMLAPQRRWETKAAAAFVHRRLRSRCPETQDDTLAAQSGVADATAEAAPAPAPASGVTLPITGTDNGGVLGSLDYSVTVGYGTPAQLLPMDFDTVRLGSGTSALRCKPCRGGELPCDPAFDPNRSSSFAPVSCGPECPSECRGSGCSFDVTFRSNHSVAANGTFVKDTHCWRMSYCGLLDLSRSRFSLVSRLITSSSPTGNATAAFSYCLPASQKSSRGFLSIGATLPDFSGGQAGSTPLVMDNYPLYKNSYLIKLSGINVGGTELPATESNLAALEVGTSFTFFPPAIYSALRDEFRKQMSMYRSAPPYRMLDTCYNFTGLHGFDGPVVILEFEGGATLQPDVHQLMYFVDGDDSFSHVCLAFAALPEDFPYAVIGNWAQQTVEVLYDVRGGKQQSGYE
ncbi:aspartyl protease family protein At5g10770-like [Panicum virgatum]|uniref:aspartyl protease family protein At5g10770-like n=1 Tax=Panicum virgatum TaxID=38727 RepID=UPI0019D60BBF|nr:aspartyl protease family protein At5g10770-like [Panicum virgatum]